jgi:hypothetical protein
VLAGFVPDGVVTRTLTAPAAPAGVVAVTLVALTTVTPVAAAPPKVTEVAPVKSVPVIVIEVPPRVDPVSGDSAVTVGAGVGGVTYVNIVFAELVPEGVVTRTLAVPATPAGVVAVIEVALTTVTPVATAPPIVTEVAPVKFVPVIVTEVRPRVDPVSGDSAVTVGAGVGGVTYVNIVFAKFVPEGVVTRTLAVPATPAGVVAVIEVALTTVTPVATAPPIVTEVAPVKFVPVIVIDAPPRVDPVAGDTAVTVGADGGGVT